MADAARAPKWGWDDHPHDKIWEAEEALACLIDLLHESGSNGEINPMRLAALLGHIRRPLAKARDQLSPPPT